MPYRSSKSTIGTYGTADDAVITVRWEAPIDNGGSAITNYYLNYAAPGDTFTEVDTTSFNDSSLFVSGNGVQLMEYGLDGSTLTITEGKVYRVYIVAEDVRALPHRVPSSLWLLVCCQV